MYRIPVIIRLEDGSGSPENIRGEDQEVGGACGVCTSLGTSEVTLGAIDMF